MQWPRENALPYSTNPQHLIFFFKKCKSLPNSYAISGLRNAAVLGTEFKGRNYIGPPWLMRLYWSGKRGSWHSFTYVPSTEISARICLPRLNLKDNPVIKRRLIKTSLCWKRGRSGLVERCQHFCDNCFLHCWFLFFIFSPPSPQKRWGQNSLISYCA